MRESPTGEAIRRRRDGELEPQFQQLPIATVDPLPRRATAGSAGDAEQNQRVSGRCSPVPSALLEPPDPSPRTGQAYHGAGERHGQSAHCYQLCCRPARTGGRQRCVPRSRPRRSIDPLSDRMVSTQLFDHGDPCPSVWCSSGLAAAATLAGCTGAASGDNPARTSADDGARRGRRRAGNRPRLRRQRWRTSSPGRWPMNSGDPEPGGHAVRKAVGRRSRTRRAAPAAGGHLRPAEASCATHSTQMPGRRCVIEPGDAESRLMLADVLSTLGRDDDAIREYETVLALDPSHEQARLLLGVLYAKRGDFDRATADAAVPDRSGLQLVPRPLLPRPRLCCRRRTFQAPRRSI